MSLPQITVADARLKSAICLKQQLVSSDQTSTMAATPRNTTVSPVANDLHPLFDARDPLNERHQVSLDFRLFISCTKVSGATENYLERDR